MKIAGRSVLLTALLMYLLSGNANASTRGVPDNLSNRTLLSQPRDQRFSFLFAQQTEHLTELQTPPSLKLKSPYMAALYSVIPGAVVHGCGHFYAGEGNTGVLLLGLEFSGGVLLFLGFQSAFGGPSHQGDADMLGFAGLLLFAGSWVYDMVGSPIAVARRNRYIREIQQSEFDMKRQQREFKLTFTWHFPL
jgi:TM2 domain-containing membrane protein YozV